jgi:hypothetical protein
MADDVLYWDRHAGGHVRYGDVQRALPAMRQPALKPLMLEFLDYRPGLVGILREHACGMREMTREERIACDQFMREDAGAWIGDRG